MVAKKKVGSGKHPCDEGAADSVTKKKALRNETTVITAQGVSKEADTKEMTDAENHAVQPDKKVSSNGSDSTYSENPGILLPDFLLFLLSS